MSAAAVASTSIIPSDATIATTLERLNSLLGLIPLVAQRKVFGIPLLYTTDADKAINYTALYADVSAALGSIPPPHLLPSPSQLCNGDIAQFANGVRGVGRQFVVWVKRGLVPHLSKTGVEEILKQIRSGAESEEFHSQDSPNPFADIMLHVDDMRALQQIECDVEETGEYDSMDARIREVFEAAGSRYPPTLVEAILDGSISLNGLYYTLPSHPFPLLVKRGKAKVDPLSPSTSIEATHDCIFFPHPDEYGYCESFASSLAPYSYLAAHAVSEPARVIDPLLAHHQSKNGKLIEKTKQQSEWVDNAAFPRDYFAFEDCNTDGLEWRPLSEQKQVLCATESAQEVRRIIAAHLQWLSERLTTMQPPVTLHVSAHSDAAITPAQREQDDARIASLLQHLEPLDIVSNDSEDDEDSGEE